MTATPTLLAGVHLPEGSTVSPVSGTKAGGGGTAAGCCSSSSGAVPSVGAWRTGAALAVVARAMAVAIIMIPSFVIWTSPPGFRLAAPGLMIDPAHGNHRPPVIDIQRPRFGGRSQRNGATPHLSP